MDGEVRPHGLDIPAAAQGELAPEVMATMHAKRAEIDGEIQKKHEEYLVFIKLKQHELHAFERELCEKHQSFIPAPPPNRSQQVSPLPQEKTERRSSLTTARQGSTSSMRSVESIGSLASSGVSNGSAKKTPKKVMFRLSSISLDHDGRTSEESEGEPFYVGTGANESHIPALPSDLTTTTAIEDALSPSTQEGMRSNSSSPSSDMTVSDHEDDEVFDLDESIPPLTCQEQPPTASRFRRRSLTKYDIPDTDLPSSAQSHMSEDSILSSSYSASVPINISFDRPSTPSFRKADPVSTSTVDLMGASVSPASIEDDPSFHLGNMSFSQRMNWEDRMKSK